MPWGKVIAPQTHTHEREHVNSEKLQFTLVQDHFAHAAQIENQLYMRLRSSPQLSASSAFFRCRQVKKVLGEISMLNFKVGLLFCQPIDCFLLSPQHVYCTQRHKVIICFSLSMLLLPFMATFKVRPLYCTYFMSLALARTLRIRSIYHLKCKIENSITLKVFEVQHVLLPSVGKYFSQ